MAPSKRFGGFLDVLTPAAGPSNPVPSAPTSKRQTRKRVAASDNTSSIPPPKKQKRTAGGSARKRIVPTTTPGSSKPLSRKRVAGDDEGIDGDISPVKKARTEPSPYPTDKGHAPGPDCLSSQVTRWRRLYDDPNVEYIHNEKRVRCARCWLDTKLSDNSVYDWEHWRKHLDRCFKRAQNDINKARKRNNAERYEASIGSVLSRQETPATPALDSDDLSSGTDSGLRTPADPSTTAPLPSTSESSLGLTLRSRPSTTRPPSTTERQISRSPAPVPLTVDDAPPPNFDDLHLLSDVAVRECKSKNVSPAVSPLSPSFNLSNLRRTSTPPFARPLVPPTPRLTPSTSSLVPVPELVLEPAAPYPPLPSYLPHIPPRHSTSLAHPQSPPGETSRALVPPPPFPPQRSLPDPRGIFATTSPAPFASSSALSGGATMCLFPQCDRVGVRYQPVLVPQRHDPTANFTLRPVSSPKDWERKLGTEAECECECECESDWSGATEEDELWDDEPWSSSEVKI